MTETLRFAEGFLRNPTKVGAIAPSSPFLSDAMVEGIDAADDEAIIEFGPGTGAFTGHIADRVKNGGSYLGIERDKGFVGHLRERYPELLFVHGSAEDASRHHAEQSLGRVRAIICGLPFASLPTTIQDTVIGEVDKLLAPGAEFRTFQYAHAYGLPTSSRFRRRMQGLLGPMSRRRIVFRNIPPAYVLTWRR